MTVHHNNLKVSLGASLEEIKVSYKKLAKKYHPDISKDDGSNFKKLTASYEYLTKNHGTKPSQNTYNKPYTKPKQFYVEKYYHFYKKGKNIVLLPFREGALEVDIEIFIMKNGNEYKLSVPKGFVIPKKLNVSGVSENDQDYIELVADWKR